VPNACDGNSYRIVSRVDLIDDRSTIKFCGPADVNNNVRCLLQVNRERCPLVGAVYRAGVGRYGGDGRQVFISTSGV
jgi:hypothetical protein